MAKEIRALIIISTILIVILLSNNRTGGFFVSILDQDDANMVSINLYDKNNNLIRTPEIFSIVNYSGTGYQNVAGVYYMDITVKLTNTGQTDLRCNIANATPTAFNNSLPRTTVEMIYGVRNEVTITSNRLDISQFENTIPTIFNVTANCNFTNETGTYFINKSGYVSIFISKEITKIVIFRTNVYQSLNEYPYSPAGRYIQFVFYEGDTTDEKLKWIAFDKDGNGIMEKYGITSSSSGGTAYCDKWSSWRVLLYMPFGNYECEPQTYCDIWILNNSQTNRIGLCENTGTTPGSTIRWWETTATGAENAITYGASIEPFASQYQERYNPNFTEIYYSCDDNWKSGDETDIDCGGLVCNKCGAYKSCISNSDCWSNLCSGGYCAPEFVRYRTYTLDYSSQNALGYTGTCGSNLTIYGIEYSLTHGSTGNCASYSAINDCMALLGKTSCLLLNNVIGNTPSGGNGIWGLYQDDGDLQEVWLCQNDSDGVGMSYSRYDSTDTDKNLISNSSIFDYSNPTLQMKC